MLNLVVGHAVERFLIIRRLARPAAEGAREVRIIAVAADRIGIQRQKFARPDLAAARLVEPRVGALAGGQEPGFDELAALTDHLVIHDGEQIVLGNAGLDRLAHRVDGGLGAGHRHLQAFYFFGRLDRPHGEDFALAIPDLAAALFQRQRLQMAAAVEAELHRAAAMRLEQFCDLVGEGTRCFVVAARHRGPHQLEGRASSIVSSTIETW